MSKENKELLLKDLCGRLPYGVKGRYNNTVMSLHMVDPFNNYRSLYCVTESGSEYIGIEEFKPYLIPMSSMTEEEEKEYTNIDNRSYSCPKDYAHIPASDRIDWLNKHHFDYRGLIEKGLALEAPKGMYKMK